MEIVHHITNTLKKIRLYRWRMLTDSGIVKIKMDNYKPYSASWIRKAMIDPRKTPPMAREARQ